MKMDHQTTAAAAATVEKLVIPEAVSLAMAELTGAVKGLVRSDLTVGRAGRTVDRSVTGLLTKVISGQIRSAGTRQAQHQTRSTDRTKDTSVKPLSGSDRAVLRRASCSQTLPLVWGR